MSTARFKHLS